MSEAYQILMDVEPRLSAPADAVYVVLCHLCGLPPFVARLPLRYDLGDSIVARIKAAAASGGDAFRLETRLKLAGIAGCGESVFQATSSDAMHEALEPVLRALPGL